jgi:hypothetical protein
MAKKPQPASDDVRISVEAVARFRHDGVYVPPGTRITMTRGEAAELMALGFIVPVVTRRDLRGDAPTQRAR